MDTARRNEIAYRLLKRRCKQEGVTIDENFRFLVGNAAQQTEIPFSEMLEFQIEFIGEVLAEVGELGKPATPEELEGHRHHDHHHCHGGH